MEILETRIEGLKEIRFPRFVDARGTFIKTFQESAFLKAGIPFTTREEFYTFSHRGVLRGLHFQVPPHHHQKLVYCMSGEVFDVVVDIRKGSPTYGMAETFRLNSESPSVIFLPPGLAHGFYVLSESAILSYRVSQEHSPQHDRGIRWDSVDIHWPESNPQLSERDLSLPKLSDFSSPFSLGLGQT